jgi:hypothetical protein
MSFKNYATFLNEGTSSTITYDTLLSTISLKPIADSAIAKKKEKELQGFVNNLPDGDSASAMVSMFNEMVAKPAYLTEFIDGLWTVTDPSTINSSLYTTNSFGSRLFDLEPKGLGRGELFLSWLIGDSKVQGGNVSFDLDIKGKKFEVKDYRNPKSPNAGIRLGTKGKVTQFDFWKEIVDTIRRLDKLTGFSAGKPKFDLSKTFTDSAFVDSANYILSRQNTILGGEFGIEDKQMFNQFYQTVSSVEVKAQGYTNVILRGPGVKPIEISILPLPEKDAQQKTLQIQVADTPDELTYVLTEIRRLKYARDPKSFDADLQSAVNSLVGSIPFIIFRNDGINLTTDFVFDTISQGGIKIVERSVLAKRR